MKNKIIYILALTIAYLKGITFVKAETCDTVFCGGGMDGGLDELSKRIPGTGIIDNPNATVVALAWVKFLLILCGIVAFVGMIWAGFLYLTSFADEENAEKAKKIIIWTLIGILVILFSYVIVDMFIEGRFD